jgi:hypothetical protein
VDCGGKPQHQAIGQTPYGRTVDLQTPRLREPLEKGWLGAATDARRRSEPRESPRSALKERSMNVPVGVGKERSYSSWALGVR